MDSKSLSDSFDYTIRFTAGEYKKHQRLCYLGAVMAQFLTQSYFCEEADTQLSYAQALHEITHFIESGHGHAKAWEALAKELQPVYERAQQQPLRKG